MRWIIRFTLPVARSQWAVAGHRGIFAMTPMDQFGVAHRCLHWPTKAEATDYWFQYLEGIGPIEAEKLLILNPEIVQCPVKKV